MENATAIQSQCNQDAKFGVALFGVGRIGQVHLQHLIINPRVDVRWVVEADVTRAHDVIRKLRKDKDIRVAKLEDQGSALNDPKVDLVMICTPSVTHGPIVIAALNARKAVFCEKPLAPTLAEVEASYALAEEVNMPLFCAFNRRWDPALREIKRRVAAGEVGQMRVVKSVSRDPPGLGSAEYIRNSGGVFIDSAVHDLDILCWLVGETPSTIYATGHATHDLYAQCDDVDSCVIVLHFPSGVLGVIEMSREAHVGVYQCAEVFGTKGMIQSDNPRKMNLITHTMDAVTQEPTIADSPLRFGASYAGEMEHFINVLAGHEVQEVTKSSVMNVNRLAIKCQQSLASKSVVSC